MDERSLFRVSCKAALYDPTGEKVLLSQYASGFYGLPGGHIDAGEMPDEAVHRELFEELGIKDVKLVHRDFWMHQNGKVVLGFTGAIDASREIHIQEEELIAAVWAPVADIRSGKIDVRSYSQFICDFQPR